MRGVIDIPAELAETQIKFNKEAGRAFIAALPDLAAGFLDRWELRLAGAPMHGVSALVLPVVPGRVVDDQLPVLVRMRAQHGNFDSGREAQHGLARIGSARPLSAGAELEVLVDRPAGGEEANHDESDAELHPTILR